MAPLSLSLSLSLSLFACGEFTPVRASADLSRVDNTDGTWSFDVAQSFDPEELLVESLITWSYVGQVKYSQSPVGSLGPQSYPHSPKVALSPSERLLLSWREDDAGGLWQAISVDAGLDDIDYSSDEPTIGVVLPAGPASADEPTPGQILTWQPASWDVRDCDSDSNDDWWVWDSDNRSVVASPQAPRQRAIVRITTSAGGRCTGTMLRDRFVLTANHCAYDGNGNRVGVGNMTVWLDWASESRGVSTAWWVSAYNYGSNGWDPDDDYSLLKLSSAFANDPGDMDISNASDSTLNSVGAAFHNLGFPGFRNNCTTSNTSLVHTTNNDITGKSADNIRWKGDSSGGHSGGPLYYCPWDDIDACDSNDKGFVVAVVAGFSGYYNRHMGPRGANFKSWAVNIMDNN